MPVDVLVFHQGYDLVGVLVDVDYRLELVLNFVFHKLTCVLGVTEFLLDVVDQLE